MSGLGKIIPEKIINRNMATLEIRKALFWVFEIPATIIPIPILAKHAVPEMKNVLVPTDKWSFGRNSDIIEYVEELSRDIFEVCVAQYSKNENINN